MKNLIAALFLIMTLQSFAQSKIRAGELVLEQTTNSNYTLTASLHLFLDSQTDLDSVTLCWGDGTCELIPTSNEIAITPEIQQNIYISTHTYPGLGNYPISFSECCFQNDLLADQIFTILQTFAFFNPQFASPNSNPSALFSLIQRANVDEPFYFSPNYFDPDGDSLSMKLVTPIGVSNYLFPSEICPTAGSDFGLLNNEFFWEKPACELCYTVAFEVKEFRDGQEIATSSKILEICFDEMSTATTLNEDDSPFRIFPNPTTDFLNIFFGKKYLGKGLKFQIVDHLGRVVLENEIGETVDIQHLTDGLYFILIEMDDQIISNSFLKF